MLYLYVLVKAHNIYCGSAKSYSVLLELKPKHRWIEYVQSSTAKSLRTWSESYIVSDEIFFTTSSTLLLRSLKTQQQLHIPRIAVSSSAQYFVAVSLLF